MQKLWIIHGGRNTGKSWLGDLLMQASNLEHWNDFSGADLFGVITKQCTKHELNFDEQRIGINIHEPVICEQANAIEIQAVLDVVFEHKHILHKKPIDVSMNFIILITNENMDEIIAKKYEDSKIDFKIINMGNIPKMIEEYDENRVVNF